MLTVEQKKQLKKQRLRIISKIDSKTGKCQCETGEEIKACPNCQEIAKLGISLNLINQQLRGIKKEQKLQDHDKQTEQINSLPRRNRANIRAEDYWLLVLQGKNHEQIAKALNVNTYVLTSWKNLNYANIKKVRDEFISKLQKRMKN